MAAIDLATKLVQEIERLDNQLVAARNELQTRTHTWEQQAERYTNEIARLRDEVRRVSNAWNATQAALQASQKALAQAGGLEPV